MHIALMNQLEGYCMSDVEHLLAAHSELGEGALWSEDEQLLYWVDIRGKRYSRFNPISGTHEDIVVGTPIGVLALRSSGGLIMAVKEGFAYWNPQTQKLSYVARPEGHAPYMRFNDGAVDPGGRFWAGSMSDADDGERPEGVLYRYDPDGSLHIMETGLHTPNGIGWSPDNRIMYFTDSDVFTIYAYDFDVTTGNITNRRVFVQSPDEGWVPDGLTVDSEGYVWSACWDGAKIIRYAPDGTIERVVQVPALRVTSCVFGGPNLDTLYITSAWTGLSEQQKEQYPLSGDLFRLKTNVRGQPKYKFGA
jgi:sugar lactone lactonase YvrE